ncbi:MAG: amidohydrolase [Deltaproteobacteria bacterium]|nr:amidohydrolase [Deltaproteobacteria bacterium]MDZ4224768.1 amidohydrolase [bacterium]
MTKSTGPAILSRYLGFKNPRAGLLLPLAFLVGGFLLARFLPHLDKHIPGGAPVVQIFLEILWFCFMVTGFLKWPAYYRQKYGEMAYREVVLRHFLWGGILMFAGVLRPIWVAGSDIAWLPLWLRLVVGVYLLLMGLLLEMKGMRALRLDRVVLIYTIFPERGEQVQSRLYEFLRHPLYAAMAHACLGLAFLNGTWAGFGCAAVFCLKLYIWSRLEENELIRRFGQGYKEYMQKVPAFIPRFAKLIPFWKTLLSILFLLVSIFSAQGKDRPYGHYESLYHDLHRHPELSLQEKATSAKLAAELKQGGFEVTTGVGGYGIVAVMKNGKGPTVLVRTDMDALPIQEATGLSYASQVPGVMHACGHDLHMTIFLATASVLSQKKDQWQGTLVMIGQPAEEIGAGARAMIAAGLFKKFPKPNYALALHDLDMLPAGKIAYRAGYMLANVDSIDVTVFGRGGHGAMPHMTIDPIVLSSQVIMGYQTIISREKSPLDPGVITVGSIHGGSKHNIIPNEVKLQLTVRSFDNKTRDYFKSAIRRVSEDYAAAARAPKPAIKYSEGTPALYNDPALVSKIVPVFEKTFGKENVLAVSPFMWGEDFSQYGILGKIPIFMFGLGVQPTDKGGPSLHSPQFAPAFEKSFKTGVSAMSEAALSLMKK